MGERLYEAIAKVGQAKQNCHDSGSTEWYEKHDHTLKEMAKKYLPSGSGIDSGCEILEANENRIIISSAFHCMNENGMYDGWVHFTVKITPNLAHGFNLKIVGRFGKYQHVKDYLEELFSDVLDKLFLERR